jgi:hypothetical protein
MLAALLFAPAALAQQGNQGAPPPPPDVEVGDAELETIAQLVLDLQVLQQSYVPKMQQAENQQEQMKVRRAFQQEMVQTIESQEGITPQRFGTVMRAAQADSTLNNRIGSAIESARQESDSGEGNGR